jgi:achromobactin transport ATP-binding protein cbrD
VRVNGVNIANLSRKEVSRRVSLMAQSPEAPEGITVKELVGRGRFPYQSWLSQWSQKDEKQVTAAMECAHVHDLANARVRELSGGQRQRAWLAMTLAQDTSVVLLDEPTTYLDIGHQHGLLSLAGQLKNGGRTVVAVLHDLQQAIHYADYLVVMSRCYRLSQGSDFSWPH